MAASAAVVGVLAWRSLGWPLVHDAPLMHYIAWLITQGAVPYRDAFDMNMPGVYLLHLAVLSLGGPGDGAWRLFDLGWLAGTCGLLFAYCRPATGVWAAAGGATLFALYHLSGGAWRAGQRDFLLGLFLLAGVYGVTRMIEDGAMAPLAGAGLALGAAMSIKPHAGLLWGACVTVAALGARARKRSPVRAAAVVAGTGLVVPGLVFGWLAWRGGLGPFIDILVGYVLPLYSRVGWASAWQALGWYEYGWSLWILFVALGALALLSPARAGFAARKWLAVMGVAYGALHFWLQGKGWEYQLYPLALFLCALVPLVAAATSAGPLRILPLPSEPRRAVALGLWAALVVVLGVKGAHALDAPWIEEKVHRVAAVADGLRAVLPAPGGGPAPTVQVLDVTEGGIHALFVLRLREPTRFLYDFHFFHDVDDPRIQALRAEFVRALESAPPAAIVVFRDTWNRAGYDRVATFPELQRLLDAYRMAAEGDGFRIYAKRSRS